MPVRRPLSAPPFNVVRASHVEMGVRDLDRTRAFYVDCLGLIETVEHADHDSRLGRLALNGGDTAAAHQIAAAERLDGGLGVGRIVALKCRQVAREVDLCHDIGLGRPGCSSPSDGAGAHGGAENCR